MKRVFALVTATLFLFIMLAGCSSAPASEAAADAGSTAESTAAESTAGTGSTTSEAATAPAGDVTIGVSIWGTSDALGSSVKRLLDEAASALGVTLVYDEQEHVSENVVAGVENLCAAGVDGIIICNSADSEMSSVIKSCEQNEVYVSQFFRIIGDEEINQMALDSTYYVGCTHEEEVDNGRNLGTILIEKGARHIGWTAWRVGDATSLARQEGYNAAVDEWNEANPDDQVELYPLVDDMYTSEEARAGVEGMIDTYPDMDAIIVVGGGGMALEGTLAAIDGRGKTGDYQVVSTDFTENLGQQLADGEISAMSGGHYADPLFSFMMVYNSINGNYTRPDGEYLEVKFPYLYVASEDDYTAYEEYFVSSLPYTAEELVAMAEMSFEELQQAAADLSIEDVASRHG